MPIKNYTIYAERDCGTKYVERLIKTVFCLEVTWEFGEKHFFGWHDAQIAQSKETLFICMTRNPYDWLMALFKHKHHVPFHMAKDTKKFLLEEWYSIHHKPHYPSYPNERIEDRYWVDGSRHKNIFQMRRRKLEYLYFQIPRLTKNNIFIRYEDLIKNPGELLHNISERFSIEISDYSYEAAEEKVPYNIEDDIKQIIDANIDWRVEKLFNYCIDQREY